MLQFHIDQVFPKGTVYPLIVNSRHAYATDNSRGKQCLLLEDVKNQRKTVVTELHDLVYAGDECHEDLDKTLILARNRKTGKVRLIVVGYAELKPIVKSELDSSQPLTASSLDSSSKWNIQTVIKQEPNLISKIETEYQFDQCSHNKCNSDEVCTPTYDTDHYKCPKKDQTDLKLYACDKCTYKCFHKNTLKRHLRIHVNEPQYSCDDKCSDESHLKIRTKRFHTRAKPYSCDRCDYKCSTKSTMIIHLRVHTREKPYGCDRCDYKCSQKNKLKRHSISHTDEKPYACDKCDFKCAAKGSLKRHSKTHTTSQTGEKSYACDRCKYKSDRKSDLAIHLKLHTGEKSHACDRCNLKFARKTNLVTHMRSHTGEKPFSCNRCDFKCAVKCTLKRHMRTHTGEKPYVCDICDYKYTRQTSLNSHLRWHEDNNAITHKQVQQSSSHRA